MGSNEMLNNPHLKVLADCGGFYSCPVGPSGNRLGPLVGYAGRYDGPDGQKLQYVGVVYANFSVAEIHPAVLSSFAQTLSGKLDGQIGLEKIGAFCGAPIGGYAIATVLSLLTGINAIKAEKKVTALATPESREKSKLFFGRHSVTPGVAYVIAEDVCNNFSTTEELIQLIMANGGTVAGIVCLLNRSPKVENSFRYHSPAGILDIPVVSLVRLSISEWKQDAPEVAKDIANGNVVLKPKDEWPRLMKAMSAQFGAP